MAKGKFRHPIGMKLSKLNVPHGDTSFVAIVRAHDRFDFAGNIYIAYFGYIEDGIFYVTSYSYSMDGFHQDVRETYNTHPEQTAMMGLKMAGILLRKERLT